MSRRGAFLLFEGVDRCGKTTQAKKLVDHLNAIGKETVFIRFPDRETTIGSMINAYLTKGTELDDRAIHLLFSANRWEKRKLIVETLMSGKHIVCDRYAYSGVAFSSAKPGLDLAWCKTCDTGLPMPDSVLFMELSVDDAAKRGGFGGERYEQEAFQATVRERFRELSETEGATGPAGSPSASGAVAAAGAPPRRSYWNSVDASGTIEEVHTRVLAVAGEAFARVEGGKTLRRLWDGAALEL